MTTVNYPFPSRRSMRTTFGIGAGTLIAFAFVPAIAVIFLSLFKMTGLPGLPVTFVGLQNYFDYFSPARIGDNMNALRNTIVFALVSTVMQVGIGLAISLLLNRNIKGRNFYRSVVFMPTILGVTVTALIWTLLLNPWGPMQKVLNFFGTESSFFGDPNIALYLVIFVSVWAGLGVTVVIFLSGLQAIPEDLYEVAAIDGASPWQRFRFVTIPMLAPAITANTLLGVVGALQSYQLNFVLTGQSNRATQVLSLQVMEQAFGNATGRVTQLNQGMGAAVSMIQFILVAIVAFIVLRFLRKREEALG